MRRTYILQLLVFLLNKNIFTNLVVKNVIQIIFIFIFIVIDYDIIIDTTKVTVILTVTVALTGLDNEINNQNLHNNIGKNYEDKNFTHYFLVS